MKIVKTLHTHIIVTHQSTTLKILDTQATELSDEDYYSHKFMETHNSTKKFRQKWSFSKSVRQSIRETVTSWGKRLE